MSDAAVRTVRTDPVASAESGGNGSDLDGGRNGVGVPSKGGEGFLGEAQRGETGSLLLKLFGHEVGAYEP